MTDLGKSTEWYQQVLCLDVAAEIEGEGFRRTRLRAPGSGVTLTLTPHDQPSDETFDERRPGMDPVALQVASSDEVKALKDRFAQLPRECPCEGQGQRPGDDDTRAQIAITRRGRRPAAQPIRAGTLSVLGCSVSVGPPRAWGYGNCDRRLAPDPSVNG